MNILGIYYVKRKTILEFHATVKVGVLNIWLFEKHPGTKARAEGRWKGFTRRKVYLQQRGMEVGAACIFQRARVYTPSKFAQCRSIWTFGTKIRAGLGATAPVRFHPGGLAAAFSRPMTSLVPDLLASYSHVRVLFDYLGRRTALFPPKVKFGP